MLIKVRTLESFQKPSDRDYRSVRRYYNNTKPLHDGEMESVRCKEDIVSISTGRERAAFDGGVETLLGQVDGTFQKWFNLKQPPLLVGLRLSPRHACLADVVAEVLPHSGAGGKDEEYGYFSVQRDAH